MNKETFLKSLVAMQAYYGHQLKSEVIEMYWNRLKLLNYDDLKLAMQNIQDNFVPTSQVPFPLIPHFLEACNRTGKNKAQEALTKTCKAVRDVGPYQTVDFGDKALHATIDRFGGWVELCQWTQKDWNINEGRFLAAYEAQSTNPEMGPEKLPGVFERENSIAGYKADEPVMIENRNQKQRRLK